ncbi:hypothetical protein IJH97_00630 [Candidatus Saccharibacteria bacterium]|nr:hypothetical protein [Candidatus Saccharibacteria bacterium]
MKEFAASIKEIYKSERSLFWMTVVISVIATALFVYALLNLAPGSPVVKIGYGDIGRYQGGAWSSMTNSGGYHDGAWWQMLAFPLLAVIYGFLHNAIIAKLYRKKGSGAAKAFAVVTILLGLATFVVLFRLLSER